jgi:hypothetical protein
VLDTERETLPKFEVMVVSACIKRDDTHETAAAFSLPNMTCRLLLFHMLSPYIVTHDLPSIEAESGHTLCTTGECAYT